MSQPIPFDIQASNHYEYVHAAADGDVYEGIVSSHYNTNKIHKICNFCKCNVTSTFRDESVVQPVLSVVQPVLREKMNFDGDILFQLEF